jgi:hypothetical protein
MVIKVLLSDRQYRRQKALSLLRPRPRISAQLEERIPPATEPKSAKLFLDATMERQRRFADYVDYIPSDDECQQSRFKSAVYIPDYERV